MTSASNTATPHRRTIVAAFNAGIEECARWFDRRARIYRARAEALNPETHYLTAKELDALATNDEDDAEALRKLKEPEDA